MTDQSTYQPSGTCALRANKKLHEIHNERDCMSDPGIIAMNYEVKIPVDDSYLRDFCAKTSQTSLKPSLFDD